MVFKWILTFQYSLKVVGFTFCLSCHLSDVFQHGKLFYSAVLNTLYFLFSGVFCCSRTCPSMGGSLGWTPWVLGARFCSQTWAIPRKYWVKWPRLHVPPGNTSCVSQIRGVSTQRWNSWCKVTQGKLLLGQVGQVSALNVVLWSLCITSSTALGLGWERLAVLISYGNLIYDRRGSCLRCAVVMHVSKTDEGKPRKPSLSS